jgi:hypothetical protein
VANNDGSHQDSWASLADACSHGVAEISAWTAHLGHGRALDHRSAGSTGVETVLSLSIQLKRHSRYMSIKLETVQDWLAAAHILLEAWAFGPVREPP